MKMARHCLASSTWDHEEIHAIDAVVKSGRMTMGTKVKEFECLLPSTLGKNIV